MNGRIVTWVGKDKVRDVYLTDDVEEGSPTPRRRHRLLRTSAKTLRRWCRAILAHHTTGASNGPVEAAMNLTIKQVKRSGRGFRNYRLRILLAGGASPQRKTQAVTSIRRGRMLVTR